MSRASARLARRSVARADLYSSSERSRRLAAAATKLARRKLQVQRRGVAWIGPGERIEQDRGVAHRPGQRTRGVLAVRDRQDAGAADQPDGWLHRDDTVLRRGR